MMSPTTPGEILLWRGTGVMCCPQPQPHMTCSDPLRIKWHPLLRSARSTSRRFIPVGTTPTLAPLDRSYQSGLDDQHTARRRYVEPDGSIMV